MTDLNVLSEHFQRFATSLQDASTYASEREKTTIKQNIANVSEALKIAEQAKTPETENIAKVLINIFGQYAMKVWRTQANEIRTRLYLSRIQQAERMARIDQLTSTGNRLSFGETLNKIIKNLDKEDTYYAVALFDLDRFKGLNDTYGHDAGDEGLKAFSQYLMQNTRHNSTSRSSDQVFSPEGYRLGGDEFATILQIEAKSPEEAQEKLQQAEKAIQERMSSMFFEYNGQAFPLVSSMGAHLIKPGDTHDAIIKRADLNLFRHKETKAERFEQCVNDLRQNPDIADRLEIPPDARANEKFLNALNELIKLDGIHIHVDIPSELNIDPTVLAALEQNNVTTNAEQHLER